METARGGAAGSGARGGKGREAGAGLGTGSRELPPRAGLPTPVSSPSPFPRQIPALPLTLAWHKVDPRLELGVTRIGPRRFARQVARLARDGFRGLTLDELLACARGERRAAPNEVAITFDDGYRALRDHAFPVLADHGFPATCSLVTDFVGRLNRWDVAYGGRRFAHLAWRDVERWRARGITFISHTATHARLTWLSEGDAYRELERSRLAMEAMLGAPCPVVSFPFGAAGIRERALAREAGYDAGFVLPDRWTGDTMAIPRLPVYPWTTPTPGRGPLRGVERWGAIGANRCAVGTAVWKRWFGTGTP